jgi:hypothetical protein
VRWVSRYDYDLVAVAVSFQCSQDTLHCGALFSVEAGDQLQELLYVGTRKILISHSVSLRVAGC